MSVVLPPFAAKSSAQDLPIPSEPPHITIDLFLKFMNV
jgi:hypothetical protein